MDFPTNCILCGNKYIECSTWPPAFNYFTCHNQEGNLCSGYGTRNSDFMFFTLPEHTIQFFNDKIEISPSLKLSNSLIAIAFKDIITINQHFDLPKSKQELEELVNRIINNLSFK